MKKTIALFVAAVALVLGSVLPALAEDATRETTESLAPDAPQVASERVMLSEPVIRVGVAKVPEPVTFTSPFYYYIMSAESWYGSVAPGEMVTLRYTDGMYWVETPRETFSSPSFIRLRPDDTAHYFTLPNLDRQLSGSSVNYNTYRGALEYRFSPRSAVPYLINELPLEEYLFGIAEAHQNDPEEYLKALLVAARSYAYTSIDPAPATAGRLFDVYANTNDQLYLGYNWEIRMPKITQFVQATAGTVVMYEGQPVTTPYFSRSNGKTKTWKTRAWANRPWLKSVAAKYDAGKKQLGHGYGMSGNDARLRAKKDGWKFEEILKHYYTGIEVERIY